MKLSKYPSGGVIVFSFFVFGLVIASIVAAFSQYKEQLKYIVPTVVLLVPILVYFLVKYKIRINEKKRLMNDNGELDIDKK